MKKSILALSAAAAIGGLGFAGSAQALGYIGAADPLNNVDAADAIVKELHPATNANALVFATGGLGHMLFVPYFSSQNGNATMLNITNTDMTYGKVVKVRFRGAANSDDILDFTLFMSPGDMWTGVVTQDPETGFSKLTSTDKTCSIPAFPSTASNGENPLFRDLRLPDYKSAAERAAQTREGYIEILNMADIWPDSNKDSLSYNSTHVGGVAPCNYGALGFRNMLETKWWDNTKTGNALAKLGDVQASPNNLAGPSGQLMASWAIVNQTTYATYGGNATAIAAVTATGTNGVGNIMMTPQVEDALVQTGGHEVGRYTADPLLRGMGTGADWVGLEPLWFDLPDMSTPLTLANPALTPPLAGLTLDAEGPVTQADNLSTQMSHGNVINEYILTDGSTVMNTDWVLSQPTRRYHAAVLYGSNVAGAKLLWNKDMAETAVDVVVKQSEVTNNRYKLLNLNGGTDVACMTVGISMAGREEERTTVSVGGSWSPGSIRRSWACGEVMVATFVQPAGGGSTVSALLGDKEPGITQNVTPTPPSKYGWAQVTMGGDTAVDLPVVGFAATSSINGETKGNFAVTLPHRWAN